MWIAIVVFLWVGFGAAVGFREVRRGHWKGLWLLGAMAGPFALPLARQAEDDEQFSPSVAVSEGRSPRPHALHVLVGVDGSEASMHAARSAAKLLGFRLGALTIATVADFETYLPPSALSPEGDSDEAARAILAAAAADLGGWLGFDPATVVLTGRPADALAAYAQAGECDLIVVSTTGKGLANAVLGSCASRLAKRATVPVLMTGSSEDDVDDTQAAPGPPAARS